MAYKGGAKIGFVHNHPRGNPPSDSDINELLNTPTAIGFTAGHNGNMYYYTAPETQIPDYEYRAALRKYSRFT